MANRCALLIGSGSYIDATFAGLDAPAADLDSLAAVLRSPAICNFDDVKVVKDHAAYELRVATSDFFSRAGPEDLLILYFTGHGVRNASGELFLCARDTRRHLLRATALAASDISKDMDLCRSSQQVLILDCCHAGAFAKGSKSSAQAINVGTEEAFKGTGRGRVVLTSSDATQLAFEGDKVIGQPVRSVFTHYLIEGLQRGKADTNGDGRITIDELYAYAYKQMTQAGHSQTPGKWAIRQQGDIVLARNPKPVPLPELIEPMVLDWMKPTQPRAIRETAVRQLAELLEDPRPGVALAAEDLLLSLHHDDSRVVASTARDALEKHRSSRPVPVAPNNVTSPAPAPELFPNGPAQSEAGDTGDAEPATPSSLSGVKVPSTTSPERGRRALGPRGRLALLAVATTFTAVATLPVLSDKTPQLDESIPGAWTERRMPEATLWVTDGPALAIHPRSRVSSLTINRDDSLKNASVTLVASSKREKLLSFPARLTLQAGRKYFVEVQDVDRGLRKTFSVPAKKTSYTLSLSADGAGWEPVRPDPSPPAGPAPIVRVQTGTGWDSNALKRTEQDLVRDLITCQKTDSSPAAASFLVTVRRDGKIEAARAKNHHGLPEPLIECFVRVIRANKYPTHSETEVMARIDIVYL
jgi:hypothetical protein